MLINGIFLLTVLFYALGQLGRISFLNQQINFYFYEFFLSITLFTLLIRYGFSPLKNILIKYKSLLLFVFILSFSFLLNFFNFSWQQNLIAFLYCLRLITYLTYFLYLYKYFYKERKASRVLNFSFYYLLISTLIIGITQYFLYPNLRNLKYLGWDEHLYRMFGQFLDTAVAGAVYGLLFIAVFLRKNNIFLKILFLALVLSALFLSFSRLALIAFLITGLIFLLKSKRIKYFGLVVIFFTVTLFLLPKPAGEGVNLLRTASLEARAVDYQEGFNYWIKAPFFGYGYNRIRGLKIQSEVNLHSGASFSSSFLIILVSLGVFGLALFVKILFNVGKINLFAYYGVIFLSILSFGDNALLHPLVIFPLGFLIVFFVNQR